MSTHLFYTVVRRAVTDIRLGGQSRVVPKSLVVLEGQNEPLGRSKQESVQFSDKEVCLKVDNHNQKVLPSLVNVEKHLHPLYVLNIYLEDAILKKLNENVPKTREVSVSRLPLPISSNSLPYDELRAKLSFSDTTTPLEYRRLLQNLLEVEKSTKPKVVSGVKKDNDDKNQAQKSGLLSFVTKLPSFRPQEVPQSGFANTTGTPTETVSGEVKTSTPPGEVLGKKAEGVEGSSRETKIPGQMKSVSNDVGVAATVKGIEDQSSKELSEKKDEVSGKYKVIASEKEQVAAKEFLKYQTSSGPPPANPRPEAEMKECSVITKKGPLMDAQSLIESNKASMAPRSLMSMKEYVEYQHNDCRTVAWLQKYKALRMSEIAYHHAQIKKHRKILLELMFKAPYQLVPDSPKRQSETSKPIEPTKQTDGPKPI